MNGSMEQSPSQNILRGLHRGPVDPGSLPPEYWNNFEPLYTTPDPPHQHPHPPQQPLQQIQQPQQQQQQSQPLGINWDHPVFSQSTPSRSPLPTPQEPTHGIYPQPTPQSWRSNSLHPQQLIHPAPAPTPHSFINHQQYRQAPQFPHGQATFDTQPLPASDNSHYQSYTFPRAYYPPQNLSVPDVFSQSNSPRPAQVQPRPPQYRSESHQHQIPQYSLPTGYSEGNSHVPINFAAGYPQSTPTVPDQTINPQFLNSAQQAANQQAPLHNSLLYLNPADYERSEEPKYAATNKTANPASDPDRMRFLAGDRLYNFYRDDMQVPQVLGHPQPVSSNQPIAPNTKYEFVVPMNGHNIMPAPAAVKATKPKKQPSVKKQSQTQAKKATMKGGSKKLDGKSASSSSESDSSDSELEIQAPEEPSPLPPTRPNEPEAAAQYDALKAVWSPRNRRPNVDKVKAALVAFKDVVKAVRDSWKESTQAMKVAENKGESEKAAQLKKDAVLQRRLMDVVVSTTLEKGHPVIVEKLGEHPMAVAALYSFLLDRHQASDIDGALTVNILKLLSRFVTMDEEVLQKTNVSKLLPRFVKRGGQIVKELAQKILDNAIASTKRKQETAKSTAKEGSPAKPPVAELAVTDGRADLAGSKRHREGEGNGQPATKRVVVSSNPKTVAKPNTVGAPGAAAKRPQEVGQENKVSAATAARLKANIIAPKPTNLFGSLSSASKRPGTSNAERAAAAAAAKTHPAEKKEAQPAPPRPTFSFGDLMADLNKQKDPAPVEPTEDRPPETEEERKKRLRKEARRKLRVTWKPDSSLTEVRLFTHDPEEELGPGDRSSREAGDVKGEGSVLKLHRDLDELEEEDDGGLREEQLLEYYEPSGKSIASSAVANSTLTLTGSETDKENISPEDRARSYVKRGGNQEPTSAEKKAQEHREATTLMVFYTSPADVPSTPKEPPPPDTDEAAPEVVSFGELPDHVKARQDRYFAMVNPQPTPAPQSALNGQFDITNLLKVIQTGPQQYSTPPVPQPQPAQAPMSDLERTFSMFRQQQQPQAPVLQMPQLPPASQAQAAQGVDFQRLLSIINTQQQMQPAAPVVPQVQPSQPSIAPNLAAIISQITSQTQQPSVASAPQSGHYEDPERKRMRESGGLDGQDDDRFNSSKRNRSNESNKKHPKAGLVPCRYWREGKCRKGDECTFRHDSLN
ncbi:hypothetical protein BO70DRAFT_385771 [Aspergillus heteromorphus CBS 117.55]|uniref:C3H1-type domain-containing protein n=1 Tax=Aspergillus heteromorphus CBS 117.55 TaxID=1448321 RepID=A0A317WTB2_9EURO|nr:uncharacterized protein BO70DRAFT_385771 [Aspergillus heteromorphus CBS 117.55]PWY87480.1 hypothetical protein BO70DRAFT_385771 [Aspergillus heteromorphus CBS 117.55]